MMRPDVVQDEGAATVSVSKAVAWRWFRQAGGVLPALLPDHPESAARTFRLSFSERKRSASCAPPARAFGHRAGIRPLTVNHQRGIGTRHRSANVRDPAKPTQKIEKAGHDGAPSPGRCTAP